MLEAARAAGFAPKKRLFKDWVSLGLLDIATRRGRGRGQGVEGTWPDNQRQLFLTLLDKRREVNRVITLCNIPVAIWLWFGDDFVLTRQTQRALTTWARAWRPASWGRARGTARQLVGRFADPGASRVDRDKVICLIARAAYGGQLEADELTEAFTRIRNTAAHATTAPPGSYFSPEDYVSLIQARLLAIQALREKTLDERAFLLARQAYISTRREYEEQLPNLIAAGGPEATKLHLTRTESGPYVPPTLEQAFNSACIDLLSVLGLYLRGIEQGRNEPTTS
jgi:hypothetical protein